MPGRVLPLATIHPVWEGRNLTAAIPLPFILVYCHDLVAREESATRGQAVELS
jgi:hypothetical protein